LRGWGMREVEGKEIVGWCPSFKKAGGGGGGGGGGEKVFS